MHDRTVSTVSIVITRKNRKISNWLSLYRNLINRTMDIRRVSKPLEPPKLIPSDSFGFTLELILMKRIAIIYCSFLERVFGCLSRKKIQFLRMFLLKLIHIKHARSLSNIHSNWQLIDCERKKAKPVKFGIPFTCVCEWMKISVPDMAANLGHNFPICQNCLVHYRN